MCVLAICLDPLTIAATREEEYARPSAPPARWENGIVAPRDLRAGGTWLGVAPGGRIVAVTNRFRPGPGPGPKSRGLLVVEALLAGDPRAAVRAAARECAGFNIAVVEGGRGWVAHYDGELRERELGPGVHVLRTNQDVVRGQSAAWEAMLASHPDVCKHGSTRGTVSATILTRDTLRHAAGPPCRTEFEDYSGLLGGH